MTISERGALQQDAARDHAFHPLRVRRVVRETDDASSFVLDIPPKLRRTFSYEAGQFCTFRVWIDGQPHLRSYSMSSAPMVDRDLQVTVKRVPGGVVSNWMNDTLAPGDIVEATRPAGLFCLGPSDRDVVAFAAGSGITPVISLLKTALATTSRRVRLLYANRDRDAVMFAATLEGLAEWYALRFDVTHHLDTEKGFVDAAAVREIAGASLDADFYVCGPGPFMEIVESTLLGAGASRERIHIERFTSMGDPPPPATSPSPESKVTVELDGRRETTEHHPGATILQTARQVGMAPPFSCESGNCASCMAKVVEGTAEMRTNNALTDEEVADGWVLTCQAVPTTTSVRVVYGL